MLLHGQVRRVYLQELVEEGFEDKVADGWMVADQKAPFHGRVLELSRECAHSQIAMPLMELVPLILRLPGIWQHYKLNCTKKRSVPRAK